MGAERTEITSLIGGAGRKFAELKKQQIPYSTREGLMGAERTEIISLIWGAGRKFAELKKTANSVQHPGGINGSGAYRNHLPDFGCWEEICGTINKED